MRGKFHNGKYRALDVPERGARARGADAEEGAVLRSEQNRVQDVVVGAKSQHKAVGDKDRKGWSDWDRRKSPEDRRRGVGRAGVPLGKRVHVGGGEHGGISCVV